MYYAKADLVIKTITIEPTYIKLMKFMKMFYPYCIQYFNSAGY